MVFCISRLHSLRQTILLSLSLEKYLLKIHYSYAKSFKSQVGLLRSGSANSVLGRCDRTRTVHGRLLVQNVFLGFSTNRQTDQAMQADVRRPEACSAE